MAKKKSRSNTKPAPSKLAAAAGPNRPDPQRAGLGGLDAAATVLTGSGKRMNCKELVAQMLTRKLWSTKGKTPAATIGAALSRDIQAKKEKSRFRKAGPGLFALSRKGA